MGIRFLCPNGHRLNVKSFLAGKRGICPHCNARFEIPLESQIASRSKSKSGKAASNGSSKVATEPQYETAPAAQVAAAATAYADERPPVGSVPTTTVPTASAVPTAAAVAKAAPAAADPIDEAPHAVWYVRPPTGGQYGPADGDIMRRWLNEGRVSADSLVWREGWPDWKTAGPLFPSLSGSAPATASTAAAPATAATPASAGPIVTDTPSTSKSSIRGRRRSSNSLAVASIVVLSVLVLVLAVILIVVYSL